MSKIAKIAKKLRNLLRKMIVRRRYVLIFIRRYVLIFIAVVHLILKYSYVESILLKSLRKYFTSLEGGQLVTYEIDAKLLEDYKLLLKMLSK